MATCEHFRAAYRRDAKEHFCNRMRLDDVTIGACVRLQRRPGAALDEGIQDDARLDS